MAFRALLFSKSAETNSALTAACQSAGIRLEACDDIFAAIEKATKLPFSCVLADWADQPETGFLLKRARESAPNLNTIAIAIVDHDPTAAEMRDHRLNFLIYRPISPQEAQEVLVKASEQMPAVSDAGAKETPKPISQPDRTVSAAASAPPEHTPDLHQQEETPVYENSQDADPEPETEEETAPARRFSLRTAAVVVLALGTAYCLWSARHTITYLAHTPENRALVFKESVAAFFNLNSGATPIGAAVTDAQQDAYFSRSAASSNPHPQLGVTSTEAEVSESRIQLRQPADLPLPNPVYERPTVPPVEGKRTTIPESLRNSAPITQPVVVTVNPAQMMPVSSPAAPPLASQQFSEPVVVSEDTARGLLVHSVTPAYPPEASAQKLHGPVVLQATIGRDGSVEDLKIVRGSFILCKAAIAAVKQWRFQPYTLNGRPAETQTFLTINFNPPTS